MRIVTLELPDVKEFVQFTLCINTTVIAMLLCAMMLKFNYNFYSNASLRVIFNYEDYRFKNATDVA